MKRKICAIILATTLLTGNIPDIVVSATQISENSVEAEMTENNEVDNETVGETIEADLTEDELSKEKIIESETTEYEITEEETLSASGTSASETEEGVVFESGMCGENVTYTLYTNGKLVISGTGSMTDYTEETKSNSPFCGLSCGTIVVEAGVTSIGDYSFWNGYSSNAISLPEGLERIGKYAFANFSGVDGAIPSTVKSIGEGAYQGAGFSYNKDILIIPEGVSKIYTQTFAVPSSSYLTTCKIPASVTEIDCSAFDTGTSNFLEFVVAETNSNFTTENGVLYNKEKTELLRVPTGTVGTFIIPEGVTTIAAHAFYGCRKLTDIQIPETVTTIGGEAFRDCWALKNMSLPQSLTEIGENVFDSNFTNESIIIPNNVTDIGDAGFGIFKTVELMDNNQNYIFENQILYNKDKTELIWAARDIEGDIVIPEGVEKICGYAFRSCKNVTNIVLPNTVKEIGDYAFAYCSLKDFVIPEGIDEIADGTFSRTEIESIQIPTSVKRIGAYAFDNCKCSNPIMLPNSVEYIGERAFLNSQLNLANFPNSIKYIDEYAFAHMYNSISNVTIPECTIVIGENAFIDSKIAHLNISSSATRIEAGAFSRCELTSLYIPEGTKKITENTFGGNNFAELVLPESLEIIGDGAFSGCLISSVVIPNGVWKVGSGAFSDCGELKDVKLPQELQSLGSSAFSNCYKLETITLPKGLKVIRNRTFNYCKSLTSVKIPEGVTRVEINVFKDCISLKNLEIPDTVTYFGGLNNCSSLTELKLPNELTYLGEIRDCNSLIKLELPEEVTYMGDLLYCSSLTKLELSNKLTHLGEIRDCSSLIKLELPDTLTSFGGVCGCSDLTSINIPKNLTKISDESYYDQSGGFDGCGSLVEIKVAEENETYFMENNALYKRDDNLIEAERLVCVLKNVQGSFSVLDTVKNINMDAFYGCENLTNVYIPSSVEAIPESIFKKCSNLVSIEVAEENQQYYSTNGVLYEKIHGKRLHRVPEGYEGEFEIPDDTVCWNSYSCFFNCGKITKLKIPASHIKINDTGWTFIGCNSMASIEVAEDNPYYSSENGVLYNKDKTRLLRILGAMESYDMPQGIVGIGDAFCYNDQLKSVTISGGIGYLDCDFVGCTNLEKIVIPDSVYAIESNIFEDCTKLTIYGKDQSYAHTYADRYNIPFQATDQVADPEPTPDPTPGPGGPYINYYNVLFDVYGGAAIDSFYVIHEIVPEGVIGTLLNQVPQPTREGYIFKGWYTEKTGGNLVTESTMISADVTYYAKWEKGETTPDTPNNPGNPGDPGNPSSPKKLSIHDAVITLSDPVLYYTGDELKQKSVHVQLGDVVLNLDTDYVISYENNINIGNAIINITGKGAYTGSLSMTFQIKAKKNSIHTVGAYKYKILNDSEVSFIGLKSNKTKKVTIGNTVIIGGKSFKITEIASKALQKKNITSLVIGSNVKKIGSKAFQNCKKLKKITIKSKVLKSVGKKAFKGIPSEAKVKVPKKKVSTYTKLLQKAGLNKSIKISK